MAMLVRATLHALGRKARVVEVAPVDGAEKQGRPATNPSECVRIA